MEKRLSGLRDPLTIAVMGCAVNGPGEAREADVGIAGGKGEGLLFRKGEILRRVPEDELVDQLFVEIHKIIEERKRTHNARFKNSMRRPFVKCRQKLSLKATN